MGQQNATQDNIIASLKCFKKCNISKYSIESPVKGIMKELQGDWLMLISYREGNEITFWMKDKKNKTKIPKGKNSSKLKVWRFVGTWTMTVYTKAVGHFKCGSNVKVWIFVGTWTITVFTITVCQFNWPPDSAALHRFFSTHRNRKSLRSGVLHNCGDILYFSVVMDNMMK